MVKWLLIKLSEVKEFFKIFSFRNFLQTNKIFFEVIAAILISAASLIVSYASLQVSERTLDATEIASLPHFNLSGDYRNDPSLGKNTWEYLFLNNYGAPIYSWDWSTETFIAIEKYGAKRGKTYLPIAGYYTIHSHSSVPTGLLGTAFTPENLKDFMELYDAAMSTKSGENNLGIHIALVTISEISYEDRFGRTNKVFFRQKNKVSESSVRALLDYSKKAIPLDLREISVKDLQTHEGFFISEGS